VRCLFPRSTSALPKPLMYTEVARLITLPNRLNVNASSPVGTRSTSQMRKVALPSTGSRKFPSHRVRWQVAGRTTDFLLN
jgi:hypothetical protein